jgi:hypothetical protein
MAHEQIACARPHALRTDRDAADYSNTPNLYPPLPALRPLDAEMSTMTRRRARSLTVTLIALAGLGLWIACSWMYPGRIVIGDILGAAFFLIALMRIMQPTPKRSNR